jgi:hypothetical protein
MATVALNNNSMSSQLAAETRKLERARAKLAKLNKEEARSAKKAASSSKEKKTVTARHHSKKASSKDSSSKSPKKTSRRHSSSKDKKAKNSPSTSPKVRSPRKPGPAAREQAQARINSLKELVANLKQCGLDKVVQEWLEQADDDSQCSPYCLEEPASWKIPDLKDPKDLIETLAESKIGGIAHWAQFSRKSRLWCLMLGLIEQAIPETFGSLKEALLVGFEVEQKEVPNGKRLDMGIRHLRYMFVLADKWAASSTEYDAVGSLAVLFGHLLRADAFVGDLISTGPESSKAIIKRQQIIAAILERKGDSWKEARSRALERILAMSGRLSVEHDAMELDDDLDVIDDEPKHHGRKHKRSSKKRDASPKRSSSSSEEEEEESEDEDEEDDELDFDDSSSDASEEEEEEDSSSSE